LVLVAADRHLLAAVLALAAAADAPALQLNAHWRRQKRGRFGNSLVARSGRGASARIRSVLRHQALVQVQAGMLMQDVPTLIQLYQLPLPTALSSTRM
jgi:hypothetical protein